MDDAELNRAVAAAPNQCKHDTTVTETYYGYNCSACGEFLYPYGSEPWAYLTLEDEDRLAKEEAFYNGWGTCAYCGGERGDRIRPPAVRQRCLRRLRVRDMPARPSSQRRS